MIGRFLTKLTTLPERKIALYGIIGLLFSSLIATFSQTHFDRVIMPHQSLKPLPFYVPLGEIIILVLTISTVLWGAASFWNDKIVSFKKVVNRQFLARIPMIIPPVFFLFPSVKKFLLDITEWWTGAGSKPEITTFSVIIISSLLLVTIFSIFLFIRLSFRGFVTSGNLEGKKVKITYLGALLLSEMISHTIIVKLFIA